MAAVAHGHSGGAVVRDGTVIALLAMSFQPEPLSRALSTHCFMPWLDQLLPGLPRLGPLVDIVAPCDTDPPPPAPVHPNMSHELDSIHLHVDGAQRRDFVEALSRRHVTEGLASKVNGVAKFVKGPQRDDFEWQSTYRVHTPGEGTEQLEFFSTTMLRDGTEPIDRAALYRVARQSNDVLVQLDDLNATAAGIVLELERVVGIVNDQGVVTISTIPSLRENNLLNFGLLQQVIFAPENEQATRADPVRYEYHFSIDVQKQPGVPQPDLERFGEMSRSAGLSIGGWFLFHDTDRWAFRSNAFDAKLSKEHLASTWNAMQVQLKAQASEPLRGARLRLLAEELLAVWRAPLKHDPDLMPVRRLAEWERDLPNLDELWVILPNFLGGIDQQVTSAMEHNLKREVHYMYFLRSHADAKRFLQFRAEMEQRVPGADKLMDAVVISTPDPAFWIENASFIANPPLAVSNGEPILGPYTQGVRLSRIDPLSDQVICGTIMQETKLKKIMSALRSRLRGGKVSSWHFVDADRPPVPVVAVCMTLALEPNAETFDMLDAAFARAASVHRGEVAGYGRRSITLIFEDHNGCGLEHAMRCAIDMQRRVDALCEGGGLSKSQYGRFGIEAGLASKVSRALGPVWSGQVIHAARALVSAAQTQRGIFLGPEAAQRVSTITERLRLRLIQPASDVTQVALD